MTALKQFLLVALGGAQLLAQPPVRWGVPWPVEGQPVLGYPLLRGVEHIEIYHATPETGMFSHHAHIAHHRGAFLAFWSNHPTGEDGPGQRLLCSVSRDGRRWAKPFECFPPLGAVRDPSENGRVLTANGWVIVDDTAYAISEVDDRKGKFSRDDITLDPAESTPQRPYLGRYGWGRIARSVGADGQLGPLFWLVENPPEPVDGAPRLPDARDPRFRQVARKIRDALSDPRNQPAWDFKDKSAWTRGDDGHLLCEPTVFRRPDGVLVKLSRDRDREASLRLYVSLSTDGGESWTPAVRTDIPDSPSKSTSAKLSDGRILLIGNQVPPSHRGLRDPLVISLSRDGKTFDWAAAIRHGAPEIRAPGSAKGRGFQYPSAILARDAVWVIYTIGKEDVAVSRIPIAELGTEIR